MGFLDNLLGDANKGSKKNDKKKQNAFVNPFAPKNKKFQGTGQSLGGSKPGKVIPISFTEAGPLGMKIEKRPNSQGTAIVAMVVPDSQAAKAGVLRGDVLCFAGSNGQEEIMYDMFLELASSQQRPLQIEVRRIHHKEAIQNAQQSNNAAHTTSAEAHQRKQAVIAAAEAREKAHKAKQKPVGKHSNTGLGVHVPSDEQKRLHAQRLAAMESQEESQAAKAARAAAKADEARLAAELGYNPYETQKSTAGQARTATTNTQHGVIQSGGGEAEGGPGRLPAVTPPADSLQAADDDNDAVELPSELDDILSTILSTNSSESVQNSLTIIRKLVVNATTKGQDTSDEEKAAKFRKVRLANEKIKQALVDVEGCIELMLLFGFQLQEDADGDSCLVYPPGTAGADWLPAALKRLETAAASSMT